MPDACLRGKGYKCGKCHKTKAFNAELASRGVVFCQCPPCPICHRKSCKCKRKNAHMEEARRAAVRAVAVYQEARLRVARATEPARAEAASTNSAAHALIALQGIPPSLPPTVSPQPTSRPVSSVRSPATLQRIQHGGKSPSVLLAIMQQHEMSAEESSEDDTTETARVVSHPLVAQVVPGVAQSSGALP